MKKYKKRKIVIEIALILIGFIALFVINKAANITGLAVSNINDDYHIAISSYINTFIKQKEIEKVSDVAEKIKGFLNKKQINVGGNLYTYNERIEYWSRVYGIPPEIYKAILSQEYLSLRVDELSKLENEKEVLETLNYYYNLKGKNKDYSYGITQIYVKDPTTGEACKDINCEGFKDIEKEYGCDIRQSLDCQLKVGMAIFESKVKEVEKYFNKEDGKNYISSERCPDCIKKGSVLWFICRECYEDKDGFCRSYQAGEGLKKSKKTAYSAVNEFYTSKWIAAIRGYNGFSCFGKPDHQYVEHVLRFYPYFSKQLAKTSLGKIKVKPNFKVVIDHDILQDLNIINYFTETLVDRLKEIKKERKDKIITEEDVRNQASQIINQINDYSGEEITLDFAPCSNQEEEKFKVFLEYLQDCDLTRMNNCYCSKDNYALPNADFAIKQEKDNVTISAEIDGKKFTTKLKIENKVKDFKINPEKEFLIIKDKIDKIDKIKDMQACSFTKTRYRFCLKINKEFDYYDGKGLIKKKPIYDFVVDLSELFSK